MLLLACLDLPYHLLYPRFLDWIFLPRINKPRFYQRRLRRRVCSPLSQYCACKPWWRGRSSYGKRGFRVSPELHQAHTLYLALPSGVEICDKRGGGIFQLPKLKVWRRMWFLFRIQNTTAFLKFMHVYFLRWEVQGDCTDHQPENISVEQMVREPIRPM